MAKIYFFRLIVMILIALCCLVGVAQSFNDPMRPVAYQPVTNKAQPAPPEIDTSHWVLSAVLISASRTVALVNGRALQVGDSLEGFQLTQIATDRVVLQRNKTKIVLTRAGAELIDRSAAEGSRK